MSYREDRDRDDYKSRSYSDKDRSDRRDGGSSSRWGSDNRGSRTFGRDKESDRDNYRGNDSYRGGRDDSRPATHFGKPQGGQGFAGGNLTAIDWSKQDLATFKKAFYTESDVVRERPQKDIDAFRSEHKITIRSAISPRPIFSFEEANLPKYIEELLSKKFKAPTPIQSQGWPAALGGYDVIGIAQTGSGKTMSFLIPAFVHINAQPSLKYGDGPIGLVLAPTRELAMQIQEECQKFARDARVTSTCIFGGADKWPQKRELQRGNHIVIATPGRLLDFLDMGVINLKRVTYLVLDEADRMLDMGFEPQIRKVLSQVRPDRQTLMWSATWPKEVQRLAMEFCQEKPVHIVIGDKDLAVNLRITQHVEVVDNTSKRFKIIKILEQEFKDGAKILIFTQTKKGADYLTNMLGGAGFSAISIHGDKTQAQRDYIMRQYKQGRTNILVATDLAARGLDVADLKCVINYDFPTHVEDYIHRVGRTGRAGRTGTSYTFFTRDDYKHAYKLVDILHETKQYVPDELYRIARRPIPSVRHGQPATYGSASGSGSATATASGTTGTNSSPSKPSYSYSGSGSSYNKPSYSNNSYSSSNNYNRGSYSNNSYSNNNSYSQSNSSYSQPKPPSSNFVPASNAYKSNQTYSGTGAYYDPNQQTVNPYAVNFTGYKPLASNNNDGFSFNNMNAYGQSQSYNSLNSAIANLSSGSQAPQSQSK